MGIIFDILQHCPYAEKHYSERHVCVCSHPDVSKGPYDACALTWDLKYQIENESNLMTIIKDDSMEFEEWWKYWRGWISESNNAFECVKRAFPHRENIWKPDLLIMKIIKE